MSADPLASAFDASTPIGPGADLSTTGTAAVTMSCPSCGFEQEPAAECVKCGVVVSKFRRKPPPPEGVRTAEEINADLADQGYTPRTPVAEAEGDSGFFAPEKKGLEKGILGGMVMMAIAVVWFGLGWAAGYIFFYPPILFVIGLFGLLKGIFAGNVAG